MPGTGGLVEGAPDGAEAEGVPFVELELAPWVRVARGVAPLVGGPPLETEEWSAEDSLAMRLDILGRQC